MSSPSNDPPTHRPADLTFARLGRVGPMALVAAFLPIVGSIALFARIDLVTRWLEGLGRAGWGVYAGAFALLAGTALMPTYALSALGGYAFGAAWGTAGAMIGCVGGALVGYAGATLAGGDRVESLVRERPTWAAVHAALTGPGGRGFWRSLGSVTLLRLPPSSPFAIMNLLMAGTRVPLGPYLLGTAGGILPRTALAAWIGAGVRGQFSKQALDDAAPPWLLWAGVAAWIVVVAVIGGIASRAVERLGAAPPPSASA